MIAPLKRWLPLALVVLVALWLRVHDLARRPMHADEANQAVKVGELLEAGRYAFDPRDHHGPTLYYAAVPIAWLRGQHTLATLDETSVRLVPAIAGAIGVLLLGIFVGGALGPGSTVVGGRVSAPAFEDPSARSHAGTGTCPPTFSWPAVAAAALMATSPPAIYYSRYFVQETLLVTFTLATLVCVQQWSRTRATGWAIGAGVCAGLMLATKESAPLFMIAAAVAVFASGGVGRASARPGEVEVPEGGLKPALPQIAIAGAAAFIVAAVLYSSFGTHWSGLRDAVAAFTHGAARATGASGHEKPWWYYLQLFAWQRTGGLVWQQIALTTCALFGAALGFRSQRILLRGAAIYLAVIAVALSLTPYKTPWHAVQFVPALTVLAAGAIAVVPSGWLGAALAGVVLATQAQQIDRVVFRYATDARNPYAYVHSSPDVLKYRALAEAALAAAPDQPVRVIGEEYWPLPWYLRGLPRVGYWSAAPETCDGALVIASTTQAVTVRERLRGKYRESYLGLRPGVICVVFTPLP